MSSVLSRSLPALVLALSLGFAPSPAKADASQICRAFTTLALAPTDLLVIPYIVPLDLYTGYTDQSDHWVAQYVGFLPGIVWLGAMQVGGTAIRLVAGTFEIIPGLITLPREKSPSALFTSQDEAEAVYSGEVGPCPIRIGTHYNTIPWG